MKVLKFRFGFSLFLLLSIILFLSPVHFFGQKVALVLSGGGSRGAAHIGVIRALEKNQIPVDYIVGTSIGAIIGGLYSIGYSPDEMDSLIKSEQFQRWASGYLDDNHKYYYRKEDPNASWFSLDFHTKKKLSSQLPANLITPLEMDFAFMELFARGAAAAHYNFDNLLIPFRCVVADVDSSKAMIMRKGDLSSAIRGSMSIPFVYKPITIDGKLIFDGGMYNNFPVDVATGEFNPEVIIGSRVAERYDKPEKDDVISQLQTMLMNCQNDTISAPNSVLIVPNLVKTNIISFENTPQYIDSGYIATSRKMELIRKLISRRVNTDSLTLERKRFRQIAPPLVFDSIYIDGMNSVQSQYVRKLIRHEKKLLTLNEIRKGYFRLIDEGFIKSIYPRAKLNPATGYYNLYLDIQMSDNFTIQFGGNISIGSNSEGFVELQHKYLWSNALHSYMNGYFGRFYNSFKAGIRMDFNSRFPWFAETNYSYNNFNYFNSSTYFFDDKTPSYIIQSEYFGDLKAGIPVTNTGKLFLETTWASTTSKYYPQNAFSRTDTADQTVFDFITPAASIEFSNLNRKQYASAGAYFKVGFGFLTGRENNLPGTLSNQSQKGIRFHQWLYLRFVWDNYFQTLGPVKLGFYGEGMISNQPLFRNYTASILYSPAFEPIPEMQIYMLPAFRAPNFLGAGLKAVVKVYKKIEYRLEGYFYQPYQAIMKDPDSEEAIYGPILSDHSILASTSIVYNTFLGPLSLGVYYYDKSPDPFSATLNFGFIIFNKRAMP